MASFGDAFKSARSKGKKTFSWEGKLYHTRTADDDARDNAPLPPARPKADSVPTPPARPKETAAETTPTATTMQERDAAAAKPGVDQANASTSKAVADANELKARMEARRKKATASR